MAIKRHLKTFNICSYPPLYIADRIKYHKSLNVKAQEILFLDFVSTIGNFQYFLTAWSLQGRHFANINQIIYSHDFQKIKYETFKA